MKAPDLGGRNFRGLALVFVLTIVNLAGMLLVVGQLGVLDNWSRWQFVGLFGVIEASAGLSNILAPNIWHMPAAELATSRRTQIKLAATALLLPHWGGGARAAAGISMMLVAGFSEGWAAVSLLHLPLLFFLLAGFLGVAAALARAGVARPNLDTVQFVVRWRGSEKELRPLSITASLQQFVLGILTLPAVKALRPGALFQPEFVPSAELLVLTALAAALSLAAAALIWRDRMQWRAPREQQREAEREA